MIEFTGLYKILVIATSLFLFSIRVNSQSIYTKAGSNNIGDYQIATNAALSLVSGTAVDKNDNIYIVDRGNKRIRKVNAADGKISTVAGGGTLEDGVQATSSNLYDPSGIAVDLEGNLYIADPTYQRIKKVNASDGIISTVAGNGTAGNSGDGGIATSARLNGPSAIAVDAKGNIYIADRDNNLIRKINFNNGIISTVAGNGTAGNSGDGGTATSAQLNSPNAIAVDSKGNLYVADYYSNSIRKINAADGNIYTIAGNGQNGFSGDGGLATLAQLNRPRGIAIDSSGNIFIADFNNSRIRKVNALDGTINTVAGNGSNGIAGNGDLATMASISPVSVTVDTKGNFIIVDYLNKIYKVDVSTGKIMTVAGNGYNSFSGDGGLSTSAQLNLPTSVAIDLSGNIYIADANNNRIRKVNAGNGYISTIGGNGVSGTNNNNGDGGPAVAAIISQPAGIAVDGAGNIYIAERLNHRIRKINTSTGIITTFVGNGNFGFSGDGGPAVAAQLGYPSGLAIDKQGNIYITDNNRIRKINVSDGNINTVAGSGYSNYGIVFSGDGGPATSAILNNPVSVAVDSINNIYIADEGNKRLRKVNASNGIINTIAGGGSLGNIDGVEATSSDFYSLSGIALDRNGNIYIADRINHKIRKINATNRIITTVAGTGKPGFSGDGSDANSALLNYPSGVAIDNNNNFFIADYQNNRIRYVIQSPQLASVNTNDIRTAYVGNNTSLFFINDNAIISNLTQGGTNSILGDVIGKVWIENKIPSNVYGDSYVARHYEITPAINPATSTGIVQLFFSQTDFSLYNSINHHGNDLPINASDSNKINLRIIKKSGLSNDGTGLYDSYTGSPTVIIPDSIIWNNIANRWEVNFNSNGFGGFFINSVKNTLAILNSNDINVQVSPNPFHQTLSIKIESSSTDNAQIILRDINGRIIIMKKELLQNGLNTFQLSPITNIYFGIYFLQVLTSKNSYVTKIVKSN